MYLSQLFYIANQYLMQIIFVLEWIIFICNTFVMLKIRSIIDIYIYKNDIFLEYFRSFRLDNSFWWKQFKITLINYATNMYCIVHVIIYQHPFRKNLTSSSYNFVTYFVPKWKCRSIPKLNITMKKLFALWSSCNELFNSIIKRSIFKSYVTCYTLLRIWTSLVSKWANCIKIECCSRLHPTHASKDCSRSEPGGRIQFNHCRAIDLKISGLIQFGFARFQGKQKNIFFFDWYKFIA